MILGILFLLVGSFIRGMMLYSARYMGTGDMPFFAEHNIDSLFRQEPGRGYADDAATDDYDVGLTDKSGSRYVGNFDSNIPAGRYFVQIFLQAGANPADGDTLVASDEIFWSGTGKVTTSGGSGWRMSTKPP